MILPLVLLGCTPPESAAGGAPAAPGSPRARADTVVEVETGVAMVNVVWVAVIPRDATAVVTDVTCEAPAAEASAPERISVRGAGVAGPVRLTIDGLLADTRYECKVSTTGADSVAFSFTTGSLPDTLAAMRFSVATDSPDATPGWTLFDPFTASPAMFEIHYAVAIDHDARVRWYQNVDGYGDIDVEPIPGERHISIGGGYRRSFLPSIYDGAGGLVDQLPLGLIGYANHALTVTAEDYWFVSGHTSEDVCVKQVSRAEHVETWSWCLAEHGYPTQGGFNAMDIHVDDGRQQVLASISSGGLVYDIDYPSGDVRWSLGPEGTIVDPDWPEWTHDTRLVDCPGGGDCVMAYANNWIGDQPRPSVALEVAIDPQTLTTGERRTWSEPGWSAHHWGSLEPLADDHWLLGIGHDERESPDAEASSIVELIPATGEVVWRVAIEPETIALYRSRHVDPCALFHHTGYCPDGG